MSDAPVDPVGGLARIGVMLEMIKFQHTVFALPFAVMSAALATADRGSIPWRCYLWILVAMVAARSAAMAFNRLVDREIDARNPRTSQRALPQGILTPRQVGVFTAGCVAVFILASYELNPLTFALSPLALAVILGYSYTKRFTWSSHWVLGLALGIAPVGAWIAITGRFAVAPILLAGAVICWTAGFDIIYSCQDVEFDRESGLSSLPQRFGVLRSLRISSLLHSLMVVSLVGVLRVASLGPVFGVGLMCASGLLVFEHRIVRPDDLSRLDAAFFTTNSLVSIVLTLFLLIDLALR